MARVVQIYLRPSARTPVRAVAEATAVAGHGLAGDHAGGGNRQVTLIEKEAWEAACRELSLSLDAGARRANIVVEGISLAAAIKHRLHVGDCIVEVIGEVRPCKLMDDAAPGLQKALSPDCRGGVYGRIIEGGTIKVGDGVNIATSRGKDNDKPP
jgi:MOSC domain-containing protein YiiM